MTWQARTKRLREWAAKKADRFAARARGGHWSRSSVGTSTRLVRDAPLRFRSMDDFAHLCNAMRAAGLGAPTVSFGMNSLSAEDSDYASIARKVAHASREDRTHVILGVVWHAESQGQHLSVGFGPERDSDWPYIAWQGFTEENLQTFIRLVEANTIPYTRRQARRRDPILDPLDTTTELQQRHDEEVASRAARTGAIYGAVAGLATTGLIQLILALAS
jgi:hypothetical protein